MPLNYSEQDFDQSSKYKVLLELIHRSIIAYHRIAYLPRRKTTLALLVEKKGALVQVTKGARVDQQSAKMLRLSTRPIECGQDTKTTQNHRIARRRYL